MQTVTTNLEAPYTPVVQKCIIKNGPSFFEREYLRELKRELEIFLKSRNFTTIQQVQIVFAGLDYTGQIEVKAS